METHLSYLRLEASLHDTMAQRADLESELRLAREEMRGCARPWMTLMAGQSKPHNSPGSTT